MTMTSVPSAASYAANVAAASVPPMRAVVRVLYRALLREAQQYGKMANQTQQTVHHEIDRLMPTQHSTAGGMTGGGKSVQISAIPIGSSSAPVIAFAISAISAPDALLSSSSTSSSPTASSFLSSSSFSFSATDVMTASIAHRLLREQFVLHLHEQRPQQLQKLVSTGFTALRKMKDRRAMLAAAIAAKAAAPSQLLSASPSSTSASAASGSITPLISSSSSIVTPPQLQSLSTAATSSSPHTRIHIVTNYVMSLHSQRSSAPAAPSSLSPAYLALSGAGGGTIHLYQYTVSITNTHPSQAIQLLSRHLLFTDSRGQRQEVTGDGVLGQQPVMQPAATHVYSSSVNIADRKGVMEGNFLFRMLPPGKAEGKEAEGRRGGRGAAGRAATKAAARGRGKAGRVEGLVKGSEEEAVSVTGDAVQEAGGAGDETKAEAATAEGEKESSSSDEFEANFGPVLLTTDSEQDRQR